MRRTGITIAFLQLTAAVASPSLSADLHQPPESQNANAGRLTGSSSETMISGRVAVLDGRTLWFPKYSAKVRLADIDSCELPQWSYDPNRHGNSSMPKPVPCGPLAKAWLGSAAWKKGDPATAELFPIIR